MPALLLLSALGWLPGCTRCAGGVDEGVKVVVPALPSTLDWSTSDLTSWVNFPVMLATQRGLTALRPDTSVGPGLALTWDRSRTPEGHERYVFHLRPDVTWSDGSPLIAQDFVVGWRRALLGAEAGDLADLLGAEAVYAAQHARAGPEALARALDQVALRAPDAKTLEVVLAQPRSYFLARLANVYVFFPVPSKALEGLSQDAARAYFDRPKDGHPLALGPFRVESWDRAGERVRLVRNPRSAFLPTLREGERPVDVVTLLRSEVGPALFDRRRVDFVTVDDAAAFQSAPRPQGAPGEALGDLQRRPLTSTYFLALNTQRPPLDRVEVRRAIAEAIDRSALMAGLFPVVRTTRVLVPSDLPLAPHADAMPSLPPEALEKARGALPSGLSRPLRLVYSAGVSFLPETAIAERLKTQLARVGVALEVEPRQDFSAEVSRLAPDGFYAPDLYLKRIGADYAHPNSFFTYFTSHGNHFTGWEKVEGGRAMERFMAALRTGDAATEPAAAVDAYRAAEEVLLGEAVVAVPLFHPDRYFRVQPRLAGLAVDPFNFISLRGVRWAAGP